jgi:hypothetical protein
MEPNTIKRPRKGKTSIRKFVFFREICEATREPRSGKLGSSLNQAFDALLIMNWEGRRPGLFCVTRISRRPSDLR